MSAVLYYAVIIPLSYLPWSVIYLISDFVSFLMRTVLKYRQSTIYRNLEKSFPQKSKREIREIAKAFYRHFTDQWLETLKLFTISEQEAIKRCKVTNPELLQKYANKHIICVMGHHNNWEMAAVSLDPQVVHQTVAIYNKVKDPFFDRKVRNSRSQFGMRMISKDEAKRSIIDPNDDPSIIYFVADQSGLTSKKVYWMPFLQQDTAVVTGPERYSRMLDAPVVFMTMKKVRRGHYEMIFEDLVSDPKILDDGEITLLHVKTLEKVIREEPEHWLWSHKRWKKGRRQHNQIKFDLEKLYQKYGYPLEELEVSSKTGYREVEAK
jgi:KDO2-lipid IV(A) lauroyltransferase